jgi:hypothetical protein
VYRKFHTSSGRKEIIDGTSRTNDEYAVATSADTNKVRPGSWFLCATRSPISKGKVAMIVDTQIQQDGPLAGTIDSLCNQHSQQP